MTLKKMSTSYVPYRTISLLSEKSQANADGGYSSKSRYTPIPAPNSRLKILSVPK